MNVFWRTKPLTPEEEQLIQLVGDAHGKSSFRQNPSTIALACVAQGTGDICRSLAAALMTIGGTHGPIGETFDVLQKFASFPQLIESEFLALKRKVPGWGNSFIKDGIDPIWMPVDTYLKVHFDFHWQRVNRITQVLHDAGVKIHPNPSAFTAITAQVLEMPKAIAPYLLIMGRLSAWAEIFLNEVKGVN